MKRITCVLLILACLISFCPINVSANQNDKFSLNSIDLIVDKDGEAYELSLPIIVKDGEFYIEPQNLADITRYQFSSDGDRLIYTLGLKSILIDVSEQTLEVNLSEQAFSGSFLVDGIHYLPMSEMLPWMNVQCYVSNEKLHIDSDIKSYWEVIEDFKPQDYLFDLAETYGKTTGDVIGLCAISVFSCILDLGNIWKKVVPVDNGETSLYEYEIYKDCFREFALPEVGTEAEVQKLLSEMFDVVSDSAQFLNAYYTPIFTQETHDKIEALFGEDIAEGFEEWPTDATQITESLKLAKDALKYMKTGVLYARIAMTDTRDYAEALRYIYMREGVMPPGGVQLAASEAISALESQAGAVANAAATVLSDIGISILEDASEEVVEDAVQAAAGDTIFGSLGLYLDIVDATLSLVWPVNDAYAEITKMTVYHGIQYDALNAYYSVTKYSSEVSAQDISNARTLALIFLKTARKCFQAQQDTFDLFGGEGVLDWQIEFINDKILKFQLASLSEENDAICDKSPFTTELKNLFHTIDPVEQPTKPQYDTGVILSDWYFSEYDRTGIEIAVLADVTHDGEPELITVAKDQEGISVTGSVYFVDANRTIQQIETLFGSDFHAGGFFGWYLKRTQNGYNLVQETFGMWQGYGEVDVTEYHLDTSGKRIIDNYTRASSGDNDPVTDEEWERFAQEGGAILNEASLLYSSWTEIDGMLIPLDDNLILDQASPDVNFGIGSSGSSLVTARGTAFFFREGSLVRVAKGEEKVLCDAPALNESLCTDGRQILYINDACVLTAVDAVSGENRPLLATGAYDTVVGATDSVIYLGRRESEDHWWGYEVLAYDWEGNLIQSYGDGWDVWMEEGYLILSTFHGDVSPVRFTVIAPDGQVLMENALNWDVRYLEGAVWYLRLATEKFAYDQPYDLELWRLDGADNRRIATLGTLTGIDGAGFYGNFVSVHYGVNSTEGSHQEMFDLAGQPLDPESRLYTDIRELRIFGLDDGGRRYTVRDGQLYRQAEDGAYAPNITLPGNGNIHVYAILDDWVFYDVYDTNTWETSEIQYTYAP